MNTESRLAAIRRRLKDDEAPAVLITGVSNMRYLTGFENVIDDLVNAACLVTPDSARFYTDQRYSEAAGVAAQGTPWEIRVQRESLYVELCEELRDGGIEPLLVESSMPYGRFTFISEHFHGAVRSVDQYVEEIRCIKDSDEIERIARAGEVADSAFMHICEFLAAGVTEREAALELEFFMRRNGSNGMPFAPIVASGPNSAHPHAIPGDRQMERGDLVVLDFGARVGGYCSDMTRTVVVGSASEEQLRLYDAVLASNAAGLTAVRSGLPCAQADGAARAVLEERGLGEYFTHGLGHGVGLDVHELPIVGRRSHDSLRAGSVVTIEPGVYVEGVGGVRIEDLVVVEESGHRLLTHAPKQLIEI
jgi:Xaa-Pro aminopeptidase